MKIDPKHISGTSQETSSVTPGRRGPGTPTVSSGTDELVLSSRAEEFRRVRPQLDSLPESRQERIAHIRNQVSENTYWVSGEDIAEAILRDEATVGQLDLRPEK